jgi:hypothetical protein
MLAHCSSPNPARWSLVRGGTFIIHQGKKGRARGIGSPHNPSLNIQPRQHPENNTSLPDAAVPFAFAFAFPFPFLGVSKHQEGLPSWEK